LVSDRVTVQKHEEVQESRSKRQISWAVFPEFRATGALIEFLRQP
jgi:hypothetical protein